MSDLVRAGSLGKGGLGGVGRQTRIEKPRPLKLHGGPPPQVRGEELVAAVEAVYRGLASRQYDAPMVGQVASLCAGLKRQGSALEASHKEQMDKLLSAMVAACRDDGLDLVTRVHMLEVIELRSMGWQTNENVTNYYQQKLAQIEAPRPHTAPVTLNPAAPDFTPVVAARARTSDPGPAPRITAPLAPPPRSLARPRPPLASGDSAPDLAPPSAKPGLSYEKEELLALARSRLATEHTATLAVGREQVVVSGSSADLVRTARIVLHEFFNVCSGPSAMAAPPPGVPSCSATPPAGLPPPAPEDEAMASPPRSKNSSGSSELEEGELEEELELELELVKPELSYEKEELLALAKSPLCRAAPERWGELVADLPGVVRRADRAGPTSKLILREMEELRRQEAAPRVQ